MDKDGSTLERLRQRLADLESAQRASGGTACAEFWQAPSPDAAAPAPSDAAQQGLSGADKPSDPSGRTSTDARSAGHDGRAGGFALPLRLDWSGVAGRLAPTLAFAVGITALPELEPTSLDEADLFESVAQLGHLQQHREVVLVRLVGDIEARGLACPGGLGRVDWLRSLDPTLTVTAAKAVVTCAGAFNEPRWHTLCDAVTRQGGNERVTVGKAAQVIDFHARLKPVADPDDLEQAVSHLVGQARDLRPEELARLVRELSDQVRPPKEADDLDQKRRDARGLWFLAPNAAGMVGLTGTLDPEGAAIIKAAIDPLSCPCPLTDEDGGKIEDDPRPGHQRRMDALIEIVARGVSSPGHPPRTEKAKVVVTIDLEALREHTGRDQAWREQTTRPGTHPFTRTSGAPGAAGAAGGGGRANEGQEQGWGQRPGATGSGPARGGGGGGSCMSGDIVTAATVRRWACDAAIIPVVLGSDSQPLDIGRQERLVTRPMRTLLWLRDKGCTFPGCSMPAQWTDAHHVRHWISGGETSVSNLALLCRRHHVYVHDKQLTATITDTRVTWHTWQHWRTTFTADDTPLQATDEAHGSESLSARHPTGPADRSG